MRYILGVFLLGFNVILAQQNFINVPSSEVTREKKIFFQQQINFNELIQSNTTLDYGVGSGVEFGVNVLGLNFSEKHHSFLNNDTNDVDPYNPLVSLNCLKQIELNKNFSIGTGGQVGLNFRKNKPTYEAGLAYANILAKDLLFDEDKWVAGVYYNTMHYGGKGTRFGGWTALELPVSKKIHLMGEAIFGNNALANSSVGIIYYLKPHIPLTFGFQIPNVKRNSYAFVFEFTLVP
jgi:hypothetical protein